MALVKYLQPVDWEKKYAVFSRDSVAALAANERPDIYWVRIS